MSLSKKTRWTLAKSFAIAGAVPLITGAGTVLFGGLSAAFNAMSSLPGGPGILAMAAGGILGATSAVVSAFNAFNKGYLGKADVASGILFLGVGCPVAAVTGGFLGAAGASTLACAMTPG